MRKSFAASVMDQGEEALARKLVDDFHSARDARKVSHTVNSAQSSGSRSHNQETESLHFSPGQETLLTRARNHINAGQPDKAMTLLYKKIDQNTPPSDMLIRTIQKISDTMGEAGYKDHQNILSHVAEAALIHKTDLELEQNKKQAPRIMPQNTVTAWNAPSPTGFAA